MGLNYSACPAPAGIFYFSALPTINLYPAGFSAKRLGQAKKKYDSGWAEIYLITQEAKPNNKCEKSNLYVTCKA